MRSRQEVNYSTFCAPIVHLWNIVSLLYGSCPAFESLTQHSVAIIAQEGVGAMVCGRKGRGGKSGKWFPGTLGQCHKVFNHLFCLKYSTLAPYEQWEMVSFLHKYSILQSSKIWWNIFYGFYFKNQKCSF